MGGAYLTRGGPDEDVARRRLEREIALAEKLGLTTVRSRDVALVRQLVEAGDLDEGAAQRLVQCLRHDWPRDEGRDGDVRWLATAHVHA